MFPLKIGLNDPNGCDTFGSTFDVDEPDDLTKN